MKKSFVTANVNEVKEVIQDWANDNNVVVEDETKGYMKFCQERNLDPRSDDAFHGYGPYTYTTKKLHDFLVWYDKLEAWCKENDKEFGEREKTSRKYIKRELQYRKKHGSNDEQKAA